jgi:hypothetical protein
MEFKDTLDAKIAEMERDYHYFKIMIDYRQENEPITTDVVFCYRLRDKKLNDILADIKVMISEAYQQGYSKGVEHTREEYKEQIRLELELEYEQSQGDDI